MILGLPIGQTMPSASHDPSTDFTDHESQFVTWSPVHLICMHASNAYVARITPNGWMFTIELYKVQYYSTVSLFAS